MLSAVTALALAATSTAPASPPPDEALLPTVEATFEHDLATPTGTLQLNWPALTYDREHRETFLVAEGFVRIFDASGMEVHRFGDDGSLGQVSRVAVLASGDILAITSLDGRHAFLRCDFRGEALEPFTLTGLPDAFAAFAPDFVVYRGGKLYFAERGSMRVVVTDEGGVFQRWYALRDAIARAIPSDAERRTIAAMDGFNVDDRGNLLLTMSTIFAGAVVSPNGEARLFGSRGSRPGRFNIIGGIDSDEAGNVYVTDRLRSVVSVWSPELKFLGEFGYRGDAPWNLLTPYELVVGNGRVLVAQAGQKGVKAYRVQLVLPQPPAPPGPPPLGARG